MIYAKTYYQDYLTQKETKMDAFTWAIAAIAVCGLILISKDKREGLYYFLIASTAFCAAALNFEMYPMALMFALYVYPCIKGLREWK